MREHQKEMIALTAGEVLLTLFDVAAVGISINPYFRIPILKYQESRIGERDLYRERMKYLKRMGYIAKYVEGKDEYLEITPRGLDRLNHYRVERIEIKRPEKWDGKWRIVIFDIKEKRKASRDAFRSKLFELGFERIQDSTYVYPFECTTEISIIASGCLAEDGVLIAVADIIQGEAEIINQFIEKGILTPADLNH